MNSTASPLFVFRALAGWWRRGFRFGCCWQLVGLLLTGCAGRVSQSVSSSTYTSPASSVSGYVLDAVSKQPLAGIPVAKNGVQTTSAKDGFFRLKYPAAEQELDFLYPKTREELAVELPGYAGRAYIPTDTTQRITLPLVRNPYWFPPAGRLHPADSAQTLPCTTPWQGLLGSQRAFLIQDSSIHQLHKLRALTFRIGKQGFPRAYCIVRIYKYLGPNQPPGEYLLKEDFKIAPKANGIFTYDMSNYNVVVPSNGFFVALEVPTYGDRYTFPDDSHILTGSVLRPPYAFADTRTWDYIIGKGWQQVPAAQTCWPRYESSVSVEVEPAR